jgi:hypothetical protein
MLEIRQLRIFTATVLALGVIGLVGMQGCATSSTQQRMDAATAVHIAAASAQLSASHLYARGVIDAAQHEEIMSLSLAAQSAASQVVSNKEALSVALTFVRDANEVLLRRARTAQGGAN